jgi:hypothetical protein
MMNSKSESSIHSGKKHSGCTGCKANLQSILEESPKIVHSKPVDKVAHSPVDTVPPTAIISTYQTNQTCSQPVFHKT